MAVRRTNDAGSTAQARGHRITHSGAARGACSARVSDAKVVVGIRAKSLAYAPREGGRAALHRIPPRILVGNRQNF